MNLFVPVMIFLGVFTQTVTGFGSALVTMSVLPGLLGIYTASPLVALMAITLEVTLLIRYRGSINLGAVWRLSAAAIIAIPIGLVAIRSLPEKVVLLILGGVLVAYSIYALITPKLPELKAPAWAFGFGFAGGLLSGAYNVAGPAAVVYGNCRDWQPNEFRTNLQAFFLLNDLTVVTSHALAGNLTPTVWSNYLIALPAIALAIFLGLKIDRHLNPAAFKKIVLLLLIVMGARMIITSIL
jgi:uncharacterized membrane protein YfcA